MSTQTETASCPVCGSAPGECYSLCPNSPDYYSPEQEREDSFYSESLSQGEHWSLAHAEWHRNAGVPMGTPGCPWDACHVEDWHDDAEYEATADGNHEWPSEQERYEAPLSLIPPYDADDIPF